jgi:PBP1b-binding outer membrane lipoprotein LpoB
MKKLFSLAAVALIALVIVGCEKKAEDGGAAAPASTNAAPK